MILTFRKHKDDSDMVEILGRKSKSIYSHKSEPWIVWGIVHADMIEPGTIKTTLEENGEVDVIFELHESEIDP